MTCCRAATSAPAREYTATKRPDGAHKKRVLPRLAGGAARTLNAGVIDLDPNLEAFYAMRPQLAETHAGQWVIFHGERPVGFYSAQEDAVQMARIRFRGSPCLIRQVEGSEWYNQPVQLRSA